MSRRTLSALGVSIVAAIAGTGFATPDETPVVDAAVSARLATARDAFKAIEQMRSAGQHIDASKHYLWSIRLMEAEREAADTKEKRVAAVRSHLDRMSRLLKDIRLQYEHSEVGRLEFLDTQFHQNEAAGEVLGP
jgi:hypothetical protein